MDAPTYPVATAYSAPTVVPRIVSTQKTSVADLLGNPAALAILTAEMPGFQQRVMVGPLKPHLANFSPRSLVQFGLFKADVLDRIDARFREAKILEGGLR